jgi:hypothetical protein
MLFEKLTRKPNEILRLRVVEANTLEVRPYAIDAERRDRLGSMGNREELASCCIDAAVGRVCGEHDRHKELERRAVQKLGRRLWIGRLQAPENGSTPRRLHVWSP